MTNTTSSSTSSSTTGSSVATARRRHRPVLTIAFLVALALAASGCYREVSDDAGALQEAGDATTTSIAGSDVEVESTTEVHNGDEVDAEADDTTAAPVRDLSGTGEGENFYVDDFGTKRDAGTDEPICPEPLPADGRDANGDYILIDGSFGLPLCGPDGEFLTIAGDLDDTDVEEGAVPLTPELEFLLEQLDLGWTDGVRCRITSGDASNVSERPCLFRSEGGGSFAIQADDGSAIVNEVQIISVSITGEGEAEVRGLTRNGNSSRWGAATRSETEPACWVGSDFEVCAF